MLIPVELKSLWGGYYPAAGASACLDGNSYWGWDVSVPGKFSLSQVAFICFAAWFSNSSITAAGWSEICREDKRNILLYYACQQLWIDGIFSINPCSPFVKMLDLKWGRSQIIFSDWECLDCRKRNVFSFIYCTIPFSVTQSISNKSLSLPL